MDLIDRQALLDAYDAAHEGPPGGARKLIEKAPSVDQVIISGWQCPICKRIYSPYTETCLHCGPEQESNVVLNVTGASNFDNQYGLRGRNWEESEYGTWKTD